MWLNVLGVQPWRWTQYLSLPSSEKSTGAAQKFSTDELLGPSDFLSILVVGSLWPPSWQDRKRRRLDILQPVLATKFRADRILLWCISSRCGVQWLFDWLETWSWRQQRRAEGHGSQLQTHSGGVCAVPLQVFATELYPTMAPVAFAEIQEGLQIGSDGTLDSTTDYKEVHGATITRFLLENGLLKGKHWISTIGGMCPFFRVYGNWRLLRRDELYKRPDSNYYV